MDNRVFLETEVAEPEIDIQLDTVIKELVEPTKCIVVYNDDVNTFQHVIKCLVKYCGHDPIQAEQCALLIHYNGRTGVKNGSYNELRPICEALLERGLTAKIE
jgi:ATP-dependent Clp protease adaptor protein ClpS